MKCIVIGLGEFGRAAALTLAQQGAEVVAADRQMSLVEHIKDDVSLAVCLDAADERAMESLGIGQAEVLIAAVGSNFEAQVLIVVYAKKLGVKRVIARALTPNHAAVLEAVGADEVLNPEEDAARRLVQRLLIPNIQSHFELGEGFSIVEVHAPERLIGKTLRELDLRSRYRINLVALKRPYGDDREGYKLDPVPGPETEMRVGDLMTVVGSDLDIARFLSSHGR